jgi:hypothetical protein
VSSGNDARVRLRVGLVEVDVAGLDGEPTAVGHRVAGVEDEVHDHLLDLPGVDLDVVKVGGGDDVQLDVLADDAREHAPRLRERLVEVDDAWREHLPPAEGEELLRQLRGSQPGRADLRRLDAHRVLCLEVAQHQVRVADDHGEEVVEIVRDASGELSDGVHLLRVAELRLARAKGGRPCLDAGLELGLPCAELLVRRLDLLGAAEHLGVHPARDGLEVLADRVEPHLLPLQLDELGDVLDAMDEVPDRAVRAEHGRVHGAPVSHFDAATLRFGARDVVLLDGHRVWGSRGEHARERRPQCRDRARRGAVDGVVGKHVEQDASHEVLALHHRGVQVRIGHGRDDEVRRHDEELPRRALEQRPKIRRGGRLMAHDASSVATAQRGRM